MFYTRFQTILRQRLGKQEKPAPDISAPFNFKQEPVCLPGVPEEEIAILREKAAASRIGVAEMMPRSQSERFGHPSSPMTTVLPYSATLGTAVMRR